MDYHYHVVTEVWRSSHLVAGAGDDDVGAVEVSQKHRLGFGEVDLLAALGIDAARVKQVVTAGFSAANAVDSIHQTN